MANESLALDAILRSIKILVMNGVDKAAYDKTYNGIITQINSDGTYDVKVNTKIYTLKLYITRTLTVNQVVKVVFPQNNPSNAFIL